MFSLFYSSTKLDPFILIIAGLTLLLLKGEVLNDLARKIHWVVSSMLSVGVNHVTTIFQKINALKMEFVHSLKHNYFLTISIISFFTSEEAALCKVNGCSPCTSERKSVHLLFFRKKKTECSQECD